MKQRITIIAENNTDIKELMNRSNKSISEINRITQDGWLYCLELIAENDEVKDVKVETFLDGEWN